MNSLLAFWNRRGTAAKLGLCFALLCVVNWTRLGLIGTGILPSPAPESTPRSASVVAPDPSRISMEQYKLLSTGMSYQDVVRLLGSEGTEVSSNDIGGTHTVMYQWKSGFMANMNATFQGGKLVSKAQAGLH